MCLGFKAKVSENLPICLHFTELFLSEREEHYAEWKHAVTKSFERDSTPSNQESTSNERRFDEFHVVMVVRL